tara:strand:+ start:723 stop:1049 length:327 start_codon:yes stop_codon:yes gene_type:complete
MSGFNLSTFSNTTVTNNTIATLVNPKYDTNCFKESLTGIDNYWKELMADLESKKKDVVELNRLYNTYRVEAYIYLINNVKIKITELEDKLSFIQKVVWDLRSKIIFSK